MIRAALIALAVLVGACSTPQTERPEPVIITKEVERIVQRNCEDKRGPLPELPDDDEDLASVQLYTQDGKYDPVAGFLLAQRYVAARSIYRARLAEDDVQIAACAGGGR